MHTPFRYDYVGSFLRPAHLKAARTAYEKGNISAEELKSVEDEEIGRLIRNIKALGYHVITDGEFRRAWWHLDFFWGLKGIEKVETADGLHFHGETTRNHSAVITSKISGKDHPFIEHFRFVKQFEDENTVAKQTIPSPAQLLTQLRLPEFAAQNREVYPDENELKDDIVRAYHQVIQDLYDEGCRNLQLDDCTWTLYADRSFWPAFGITDEKLKAIAEEEVELNNRVIACRPEGMVINTHVCRGNFHSTYANSGPYDPIAPYLFAKEDVDAFYLEYDDARSGGFEPLKYVPKGKKVVLGLITTKRPELEDKGEIMARIRDAARYVDLKDLCISTQCGFASTEEGNILLENEQWNKLQLIKEIAEEVWGKEE
ncbi:MAG: 5-methyltetrahydropteroyltriglutamate--homocysteine S-methyltransferase [Erysipelotrichaceae bacterium]|jgi:methionine synthase II (cobalamin-independent)|nr:5-methyltetrahydropteroyltriglutamate--homocysteine S-methyltransferase [Erysipelotrichaceae bacterium]